MKIITAIAAALLTTITATPGRAQAFADLKSALVDYSQADLSPRTDCEALGKFKAKEIAQITAAPIPATSAAPAHCRVTGLLSPEIAFGGESAGEVERSFLHDRQRWACGRSDGRPRTRGAEECCIAGWVCFRADEYGPRCTQRAGRELRAEQPAEGHRLCLACRAPDGRDNQKHYPGVLRQARFAGLTGIRVRTEAGKA